MKKYQTTTLSFSGDLAQCVERAYEAMLLDNREYPYLINCRNFIPDILKFENDVQRYFIFNEARQKLFTKFNITEYPTACALGSTTDEFVLSYTRSTTPATFFENPNQVSAYKYPKKYGNPLFSRAGMHDGNLLISGTASIKNSETVFKNDVAMQTTLTLSNIQQLKNGADANSLKYNIYVKNKSDNEVVRSICESHGVTGDIINVDICRDDLLVEIEAYSKDLNI